MQKKPGKQVTDGKTVQYTTLKIRLYPTQAQAELFENTFGCYRYIWNRLLADQQRFYLETDKHFKCLCRRTATAVEAALKIDPSLLPVGQAPTNSLWVNGSAGHY